MSLGTATGRPVARRFSPLLPSHRFARVGPRLERLQPFEEVEGAEPVCTPVNNGDELAGRRRGIAGAFGNFSFPCFCDESCGRGGENSLEG